MRFAFEKNKSTDSRLKKNSFLKTEIDVVTVKYFIYTYYLLFINMNFDF